MPLDDQPPLVLVADDDIFIRGMLKTLIEKQGYRVVVADEGVKALEEFQRCTPDLVLMDAVMPVMDGFKTCAELKKLKTGIDTPVIMITSLNDETSVNQAFEAGAVEYITKPIHWAVLRHRMTVIIKAWRTRAALRESELSFQGIFEQAAIGIALVDLEGQLIHCNLTAQELLGLDEVKLREKSFNQFFYPRDSITDNELRQQLLTGSCNSYQVEKYFWRGNISMLWGRITTSLVRNTNGLPQYFVQMIEDVTEYKSRQTSVCITDVNCKSSDSVDNK